MKKILFCTILCIMALIYSCNKIIEVDQEYQVNVKVNPSEVINAFIPVMDGDFDLIDDEEVRINLFVYDANGGLVEKYVAKCIDYSHVANFSFKVPTGDYTFIATSDIYIPSADFETWSYHNVDNINEISVEQNSVYGPEALLGINMTNAKVDKPQNITMSLTPATALIRWEVNNIHYNTFSEDTCLFAGYSISLNNVMNKSLVIRNNGFAFEMSSDTTHNHIAIFNPADYINNDTIGYYASILPVKNTSVMMMTNMINLENGESEFVEYSSIESVTASFESGEQYLIKVDLQKSTLEVFSGMDNVDDDNVDVEDLNKITDVNL